MNKISKYIDPQLIAFLEGHSRDQVLEAMVDLLDKAGKLHDREAFHQAILDREQLVSTGIGLGLAIPHAKLPGYDTFFIAITRLDKAVDWKAIDSAPVRLIFMIGGPDDRQTEYLNILSSLTHVIKDEEARKKVLTANSKEAIIQLFA
jgi:PTS system nitrogen regulatory IIA component